MSKDNHDESENVIHILHIDDDLDHLMVSKRYIQKYDGSLRVTSITSPQELLEKYGSYDCILSDYKMPEINGIALAEQVNKESTIPYILYTGQGSEEVAEAAFQVGIDDYIKKEYEHAHYQVVVRRIRMAVERNRSQARWLSLVDLAPDGIVTMDVKGVIDSVNPAVLKMSGYSEEEIVGKHFTKLNFFRIRDIPKYSGMFNVIVKGEIPAPVEVPFTHKNGATRWIEAHFGLLVVEGKRIGIQAILRDITERKEMEEEIRRYVEHFEEKIEKENWKRFEANEELNLVSESSDYFTDNLIIENR
jgi:PAS domain S-box-containing protein